MVRNYTHHGKKLHLSPGHPSGSFNLNTIGQFYFPVILNTLKVAKDEAAHVAVCRSGSGTRPPRRWEISRRRVWPEELMAPKALTAKKESCMPGGRG